MCLFTSKGAVCLQFFTSLKNDIPRGRYDSTESLNFTRFLASEVFSFLSHYTRCRHISFNKFTIHLVGYPAILVKKFDPEDFTRICTKNLLSANVISFLNGVLPRMFLPYLFQYRIVSAAEKSLLEIFSMWKISLSGN